MNTLLRQSPMHALLRRRSLPLCALCLALPLSWPTRGVASGGDLEGALDSVDARSIQTDIEFIASDALAGRDSPSPGLRAAARYIRDRLKELGIQPGASDGYFYNYPLRLMRLDEEASSLGLRAGEDEVQLTYGTDYFLYSTTEVSDIELEGEVVFCAEGSRSDFKDLELEGRWALCWDTGGSALKRRNSALRAGASGLIVTPHPDQELEPYGERFSSVLGRTRTGVVSWPSERRRERAAFPQVFLSREAGARLLALGGVDPELGVALGVTAHELRSGEGSVQMENVCGLWPGDDPELAQETIIVSAHYDHVGESGGEIYNGADDNGSGTCGLMALAGALAEYGPMRRSVLLIWVSGEEKGLWGSKAWAQNPWLPEGYRPIANINIDMIGRNEPDSLLITPTAQRGEDYNGLVRAAERLCVREGFSELGSADAYYHRSDQAEFAKLGIPVCFLFADVHEDYHRPTDTPDKIDTDKIRRVARLVLRLLDELQADELDL